MHDHWALPSITTLAPARSLRRLISTNRDAGLGGAGLGRVGAVVFGFVGGEAREGAAGQGARVRPLGRCLQTHRRSQLLEIQPMVPCQVAPAALPSRP